MTDEDYDYGFEGYEADPDADPPMFLLPPCAVKAIPMLVLDKLQLWIDEQTYRAHAHGVSEGLEAECDCGDDDDWESDLESEEAYSEGFEDGWEAAATELGVPVDVEGEFDALY